MAGIITDFKNDIQRLQDIKKAIADVKNELKSINIKVDIDIAKGLEARLKSLTTQYNALVAKIAEAEGKIMLSTKKINDASEKIIQAQEKMSKAAGIPTGNTSSQANTVETTSIQAQAKAYDELRDEIDNVIGTRSQNIKRMLDEQNAIRLINAEIKKINKSHGESSVLSSAQQRRLEQLNNSLLTHKTALAEVRQSLINNVKLDNVAATSMNGLSQSLSRMRITYRELTEEERKSPFGKELLTSINQADAKIKELDATIGNHQRNVGNYASGFNGLNMSVQQIVRELPAATMGLNMFFLAISNNLPILTDEIRRAKAANEELKRSGNTGIPVWKQLAKSLFSWQSAMMVGITLLTVYGKEIGNWVGSLFSAGKALSETYQKTEEFQKKVGDTSGSTLATLEKLSIGWKRLGNDINAQKKYILDNKDAIDSMGVSVTNVVEAERLFNTNKDAFIQGIIQRAQAAATMEIASEEYKKSVQKMLEADAKAKEGVTLWDKLKSFFAKAAATEDLSGSLLNADLSPEVFAREKENNLRKKADKHKKSTLDLIYRAMGIDEESRKKVEEAGGELTKTIIDGSIRAIEASIALKREALKNVTNKKDYARIEAEIKAEQDKLDIITGQKDKKLRQQQQKLSDDLLSLRRKNQQDELDLMKEGTEKKIAQIELDYQKEIDAYNKARASHGETNEVKQMKTNADDKRAKSIAEVTNEQMKAEAEAMHNYLKEYGTFQQKKLALKQEYEKKVAQATTKGDKLSLQKQLEEALSMVDMEQLKKEMNWEGLFGNLAAMTKQELDNVKKLLDQYKKSKEYKNSTIESKKEIEEAYNKIEEAINQDGGLLGGLLSTMREYEEALKELSSAQEEYDKALLSGVEEVISKAREKLTNAQNNVVNKRQNVSDSQTVAIDKMKKLSGVITELGNASELTLSDLGNLTATATSAFSEAAGKIGGIIGAILGILDSIGDQDIDTWVDNIATKIFTALGSAFDSKYSLLHYVAGDLLGSSDKSLEEDIERLIESNKTLREVMDTLADRMKEVSIADATDEYDRQKQLLEEQMRNTQEMMQRSGAAYSNGFLGIGGSHSSNRNIDKAMSSSDWEIISKIVGRTINSAGDFWTLTSKEMAKVKEEATELYIKIKSNADDGYKNAAQYMDEYIKYYKELEELENNWREKLTSVSFNSVRDDFKNTLLDMKSDTEDFVEDFEKLMQNAMIESLMTTKYDKLLQEWYEDFAKAMKDGNLSEDEQKELKKRWNDTIKEGVAERDALKELMGWTSSSIETQTATRRGVETITQDQAGELTGRITDVQGTTRDIKAHVIQQTETMSILNLKAEALLNTNNNIRNIADETRTILANSYLELRQISDNTGAIITPIKEMNDKLEKIQRNTENL